MNVSLLLECTEYPPLQDRIALDRVESRPWFSNPAGPRDGMTEDHEFFSLAPGGNTFIHLGPGFEMSPGLVSVPYYAIGIEIQGEAHPGTYDYMTPEWIQDREALGEKEDWKQRPEFEGWDEEDLEAGPPVYVWVFMDVARRKALKIIQDSQGELPAGAGIPNAPRAALQCMGLEQAMGPARLILVFCNHYGDFSVVAKAEQGRIRIDSVDPDGLRGHIEAKLYGLAFFGVHRYPLCVEASIEGPFDAKFVR